MIRFVLPAGLLGLALLAACGGGGSAPSAPMQTLPQSLAARPDSAAMAPAPAATSTPLIVYVGFRPSLKTTQYGTVADYTKLSKAKAATEVIYTVVGKSLVFENNDTTNHTASGLGSKSFPASFDNTSGINRVGSEINSSLTWATGTLSPHEKSQVFTVGPVGTYYFGCYFHYHVTPNMRDVIISQAS
jgi:plastocyanin